MHTVFDVCQPRPDVLKGTIQESDFAADLAQVLRGDAPEEYKDPAKFFANTYPTRGLRNLLLNVALRLSNSPEQIGSIFRLDTQYGGGKTHALIALTHAVQGMKGVANAPEFVDIGKLPKGPVRIAAYDGENADPANGRKMSAKVRAYTPWGELAFGLGGETGYRLVEKGDQSGIAPGAETIRELLGDKPCLILLDELSVYLRKLSGQATTTAAGQLTAFLTSLIKAVESSPKAALVYTLALGKDGRATDAYSQETQSIASFMAEAGSVSARKATLLDPTEEDETVKVLCRRLFSSIDADKAKAVVSDYKRIWDAQKDLLPKPAAQDRRFEEFQSGYPLHPELIATLTNKISTLGNFQRVRGMLRLLARTVAHLWKQRPADAHAIHLHHLDLAHEPIRQEIVTRLGQNQLVPAIKAEVAAHSGDQPALAQDLDAQHYAGLPPYGSYVARCVLFHTLAFNDALRGLTTEELRYSIVSPSTDISFIEDARKRFVADSAYLDDRPNVPLRFLAEANLTQMIRRQEQQVDLAEVRSQLNDRIRTIFNGTVLNLVPFVSGPHDVGDDSGEGRPALALVGYDAASIPHDAVTVPDLVTKTYVHKGSGSDWRHNRNNVVFLVADSNGVATMKAKMTRRLALGALRSPDRLRELAEYQQKKLGELYERSNQELALGIQQTYRHIFYPSRNRLEGAEVDLAHTVVDVQTASDRPGDGQKQVVTQLQNINKLRLATDPPDSPAYVRDRTPLKKGQITTLKLRSEFREDPALPMLVGDDVYIKGIRLGIDQGEYIYKSGELLLGKGDPFAEIKIDEQSLVFTTAYAREHKIWPRPAPQSSAPGESTGTGGATGSSAGIEVVYPPIVATGTLPADEPGQFVAEDALRAALTSVFEKARQAGMKSARKLRIRPFDPQDALKLLSVLNAIPNATKLLKLQSEIETSDGSNIQIVFQGSIAEALPLKDYLDPQLRAAKDKELQCTCEIVFEPLLSLAGDAPQKLIERIARLASGAAEVVIVAEKN